MGGLARVRSGIRRRGLGGPTPNAAAPLTAPVMDDRLSEGAASEAGAMDAPDDIPWDTFVLPSSGRARPSGRRRERSGADLLRQPWSSGAISGSTTSLSTTPTSRGSGTPSSGCSRSGSGREGRWTWRRYRGASATIVGIDVNPNAHRSWTVPTSCESARGTTRTSLRAVDAEFGPFDLILDDGSHHGRHQRASFDVLFPAPPMEGSTSSKTSTPAIGVISTTGVTAGPGRPSSSLKDVMDDLHGVVVSPS